MDPSHLSLFDLAEKRLAWVDRRQQLLAQNVANANTPGFQPRDAPAFDAVLRGAQIGVAPARTDPRHLAGTLPDGGRGQAIPGERAPDGNAVSLDDQLTRIADTDAAHDLATGLYKKYLTLFRTALGR